MFDDPKTCVACSTMQIYKKSARCLTHGELKFVRFPFILDKELPFPSNVKCFWIENEKEFDLCPKDIDYISGLFTNEIVQLSKQHCFLSYEFLSGWNLICKIYDEHGVYVRQDNKIQLRFPITILYTDYVNRIVTPVDEALSVLHGWDFNLAYIIYNYCKIKEKL